MPNDADSKDARQPARGGGLLGYVIGAAIALAAVAGVAYWTLDPAVWGGDRQQPKWLPVAPDAASPARSGAAAAPLPTNEPAPTSAQPPPQEPVMPKPAPKPVSYASRADALAHEDPVALYDEALDMTYDGKFTEAARNYEKAFAKGNFIAGYRLAKLYEKGDGLAVNLKEARRLTEWAAGGGNIYAMHDLAIYYAEGEAGPQSYAAAFEWLTQAAGLGVVDSQFNLGILYEKGLGAPKDLAKAAYWFDVSGRSRDDEGGKRAEALYRAMPAEQANKLRLQAAAFCPQKWNAKANGDFGVRSWEDGSIDRTPVQPSCSTDPAK